MRSATVTHVPGGRVPQSPLCVLGRRDIFCSRGFTGNGAGYEGTSVRMAWVLGGTFLVCVPVEHFHMHTTGSDATVSDCGRGTAASGHAAEPRNDPAAPPSLCVNHECVTRSLRVYLDTGMPGVVYYDWRLCVVRVRVRLTTDCKLRARLSRTTGDVRAGTCSFVGARRRSACGRGVYVFF